MARQYYLGEIRTEEHWFTSGNPERMEHFLGQRGSRRRWRLFACACCWRIWPLLSDEAKHAVSVAERQAEGLASPVEVEEALEQSQRALLSAWQAPRIPSLSHGAMAVSCALSAPRRTYAHAARATGGGEPDERLAQCQLLRELFGNPFRPSAIEPGWRTPTVLAIAQDTYEKELWHELPVLADALEDVSCADVEILAHCRAGGPHVRGCWVVDALLEKDTPGTASPVL